MTILIVDDNEENTYQLRVLLGANDYRVVAAANGAEALAKARQNPPDLIISDILMPVMDGFSLCREWKKDERLRSIPFIFYTATYTHDQDQEFALSLGAQRFLVKPEDPDVFIRAIRDVIEEVRRSPVAPAGVPVKEETAHLQQYNAALIRKLEAKMLQLEQANRKLERNLADRTRAEEALRFANVVLSTQQEAAIDGILVVDENSGILSSNRRFAEMWGIPDDIVKSGSDDRALQWVMNKLASPDEFIAKVKHLYATRTETSRDEIAVKDGRTFDRYSAPMRGDDGKYYGRVWYFRDVTERKQAEARIRKLLSMQDTIRQVNEALLRTKSEEDLYQKVCNLLVNLDGIVFAWIGMVQKDTVELKPVARSGNEGGYLSVVKFTRDDSVYGRGPAGVAVKTGQPCIINDIKVDDRYKTWRREALERGFVSVAAIPLLEPGGSVIGMLALYSGVTGTFEEEVIRLLLEVASDIAVGIKSIWLEKKVQEAVRRLQKTFEGTIEAISLMSETRDPYTAGHERKVAQLSREIGREMGLTEDRVEGIRVAAFLHDIGKIAVPAEILTKPGRLKVDEFNLIKVHSETGYNILKGLEFPWPLADIVLQHHERLDGSGYPSGLKGDQIGLDARIIAVADVVEAMASHRPYRAALGIDNALQEISKNRELLYDPAVVEACLAVFRKGFRL